MTCVIRVMLLPDKSSERENINKARNERPVAVRIGIPAYSGVNGVSLASAALAAASLAIGILNGDAET